MSNSKPAMTSRERLLATLRGELPDRVPVSPFVQEEYLSFYYPEKRQVDRVVDAVELANELDFDLMAKHRALETPPFFRRSYPNWELRRSEARVDGMIRRRLEIVTPSRTLTREEVGPDSGAATAGVHFQVTRPPVQDADDGEAFLKWLPALDAEDRRLMRECSEGWRRVLGDRGVLAPWGFAGVFNFCADLCGMDNLYVAPYLDEPAYRVLMGGVADAMCAYSEALGETAIDAVGIQAHIAGGATTGPEFFRHFVQPYEKRLIDAIHAAGKFSVYHNCGCAKNLYENYRELGMTVWETVSGPPRGDNDLAEAKAALGDRLCLLGNLDQVDFLKRATPQEVEAATRAIVRAGKPGGRFIFAASDYLEKGTPRENVLAMLGAAKDEGRY
jgi:uroporphyrinogen decarboxylase